MEPMLSSIQIREKLLGPYNKYNARIYTILMELTSIPDLVEKYRNDTDKFYRKGHEIFNKIDFTIDSMLVLYSMQLETTYLIIMSKTTQAC